MTTTGPGTPAQLGSDDTQPVAVVAPPRRRRRGPLVAAAVVVVLALAAGLWWLLSPSGDRPADGPAAVPAGVGPAPAGTGRTLDVAADGSRQYRTIADAAADARPGDTVLVQPGSYAGFRVPRSGTDGQWITYRAAPGGRVVIDSGDGSDKGRLDLSDRAFVRISGIAVAGADRFGVYAENAANIVLERCEVADSQHGGVVFLSSRAITVEYCDVHGNNALGTAAEMEAISMDGVDGFEVVGCTVRDNGEEGIDAKYEARNGRIHGNTVTGNRGPNIYVDAAHDIVVSENKVSGATGPGKAGIMLGVEDYSDSRRTANVDVVNNVVTGNNGGGIAFWVESEGEFSGIRILNNTVVGNEHGGLDIADGSFSGTVLVRNNLFADNERGDVVGRTQAFSADHNLFTASGIGSDRIGGAPAFLDRGAGDLRLAPDSPGVDAGSADGAPATDIAGVARPAGRAVDVGAYEVD